MKFARPTQFLNIAAVLSVICLLAVASQAQTYTVIDELLGQLPSVLAGGPTAVQGRDGAFYATSLLGGTSGLGTILKFTSSGTVTTLYSFDGTVGQYPSGGLTLGSDGNFYGTANRGSTGGNGSIFKVTSAGAVTLLHAFTNTGDGTNPAVPPVLGTDGNFYGTASGVDVSVTLANSTIYKITPSGNFSVIHTLDPVTEGSNVGYLILGIDGNFYGAAVTGGVNGWGTIFKVTPTGALTVLHAFNNSDGRQGTSLAQAANGTLYGATFLGGSIGDGVIFKITPSGTFTKLHDINNTAGEGSGTIFTSIGSDGNFYNTALSGGANNAGTIYKFTPSGTFTKLFDFGGTNEGVSPQTGLMQSTSGLFFGSTEFGGAGNEGVLYSFNVSLPAFASLVSTTGKEGAKIGILGQGFSASTVVKFGGVQATSIQRTGQTFINATVPAGALTGSVTVTTGSTTLTSTKMFKVKPTILSFTPPSGAVGSQVTITGTGLLQTTKVTFHGTSATFTIDSDTQLSAIVPSGATTGKIAVTTKGGSAQSATNFTVN